MVSFYGKRVRRTCKRSESGENFLLYILTTFAMVHLRSQLGWAEGNNVEGEKRRDQAQCSDSYSE